ncbi:hypothetical protein EAI_05255 [Harpegnathos saltator]|uniref:Uncharacterized protein n=1 Tax=Harpegnathos saltator TaxID=610380 RepID=E2B5I7_HARSA|nr:hypothetical protein EAI_05255 [Harpegnathos saltator]
MNGMQFICELLTQNFDGSAVTLQKIVANTEDADMIINLYELLHIIHAQKDSAQRDMTYQCLTALLDFCYTEMVALIPHLCAVMSNYDLVFNVTNTRHVSCHFVKFASAWLCYRKTSCNDALWNSRSLYRSPFDEVLVYLKEYSIIINTKGLKDAYLELQHAVNVVPSILTNVNCKSYPVRKISRNSFQGIHGNMEQIIAYVKVLFCDIRTNYWVINYRNLTNNSAPK